ELDGERSADGIAELLLLEFRDQLDQAGERDVDVAGEGEGAGCLVQLEVEAAGQEDPLRAVQGGEVQAHASGQDLEGSLDGIDAPGHGVDERDLERAVEPDDELGRDVRV